MEPEVCANPLSRFPCAFPVRAAERTSRPSPRSVAQSLFPRGPVPSTDLNRGISAGRGHRVAGPTRGAERSMIGIARIRFPASIQSPNPPPILSPIPLPAHSRALPVPRLPRTIRAGVDSSQRAGNPLRGCAAKLDSGADCSVADGALSRGDRPARRGRQGAGCALPYARSGMGRGGVRTRTVPVSEHSSARTGLRTVRPPSANLDIQRGRRGSAALAKHCFSWSLPALQASYPGL